MAKIISDKYASKDDPIFTGRYTISSPKASTKKPVKVNKENLKETDSFFDGVRQIKRRRSIRNFLHSWVYLLPVCCFYVLVGHNFSKKQRYFYCTFFRVARSM